MKSNTPTRLNRATVRTLPGYRLGTPIALGLIVAACPAATAAQQLWNIEEVAVRPATPIVRDGMAAGAATAAAGALPAEAAAVQVAFDYLRLGMGYLELPLPDGSMIAAENAVFEDRGEGNLMWTGEVPGAGYESVLFTVQDGHLVGWFGEPGGPKYVVYAGPDGRGSLTVDAGQSTNWCRAISMPRQNRDLKRDVAQAVDRTAPVTSASHHDSLEILLLYTEGAAVYWQAIGGPQVGVQQFSDYLNMVFRNGELLVPANLIPVRWDPDTLPDPNSQGGHFVDTVGSTVDTETDDVWHWAFKDSQDVARFAALHRVDLVHFVTGATLRLGDFLAAGEGELMLDLEPRVRYGWSIVTDARTFAHEVGHNLGGHHEPEVAGGGSPSDYLRPYGFGHTDMTSCAKDGAYTWCPMTIMSYGSAALRDDDPWTIPSGEPFFSSVRYKPNGWTLGVSGERENERVFQETLPVAARSGDEELNRERFPRRVTARWTDVGAARVTWAEQTLNATVFLTSSDGSRMSYTWNVVGGAASTYVLVICNDEEVRLDLGEIRCVRPLFDSDGWVVGVDVEGLAPGRSYVVSVRGGIGDYPDLNGNIRYIEPLVSEIFLLRQPARAVGSPAAASHVGGESGNSDNFRLHWRDNSGVETGYEVWYRKWSGDKPDQRWNRYGSPLPANTRFVDIKGLEREDVITTTSDGRRSRIGRYSFVVVASNEKGWSASETFHAEVLSGPHPTPTASGRRTNCAERPTGLSLERYEVYVCVETPDGARRRAWDYRLTADQSGLLYFFDRDNAEMLVKVLDGCAINGHRWVFLAPVTTLPFRLLIREAGPYLANRRQDWYYDSERRPQDQIQRNLGGRVGNPKDRTARTVSDTTAFPCTTTEIAAAKAASSGNGAEPAAAGSPVRPLIAGAKTDCEPGGPTLTLRGGYTVSMCYEAYDGPVGDAIDWGLDSSQSGLMYFFDRDNAEVLIKVLDGCEVNGHRWVFVAPVTDLAFNLVVESPDGQRWTHSNRLGQTADAASDVSAFPCSA